MTTKVCPKCGCSDLVLLHGEDKKMCTKCLYEIDWPLDEGQRSVFRKNVVGAKNGEVTYGACNPA